MGPISGGVAMSTRCCTYLSLVENEADPDVVSSPTSTTSLREDSSLWSERQPCHALVEPLESTADSSGRYVEPLSSEQVPRRPSTDFPVFEDAAVDGGHVFCC